MLSICGNPLTDFAVYTVWKSEQTDAACKKLNLIETDSMEGRVLILDSTSLRYDTYGVDITADRVRVWGSYRSFPAAVERLFALLEEKESLTDADSVEDAIPLPVIPYKNKAELLELFTFLQNDRRLLFGQHLAGGVEVQKTIDEYTTAVGQGPSIIDFDFCGLRNHPQGAWSKAVCELVDFAAKGGVITTMHHWLHPVHPESNSYRGHVGGVEGWMKVLTKGTLPNENWHVELDRGAAILGALQDAGVAVVWRPMHEANGGWFWFGAGQEEHGLIPADMMVDMWKYVYRYYTDECKLSNLVWSYSPNISDSDAVRHMPWVKYYYPGNEYCDIVGFDWYTGGKYEFDTELYESKCYDRLMEYGKPFGFAEWGFDGNWQSPHPEVELKADSSNYVAILERFFSEGKNLAYAEVYGGVFGAPSWIGNGKALKEYDRILALEDMPALLREVFPNR